MAVRAHDLVREGLGQILEPLVLVLLKSGVSWKEFADCGKAKFVQVATENFGIRDRPTNISRVSILTGLDRRDVRKIRRAGSSQPPQQSGFMSKPTQVLDGWYHDAEFHDDKGRPRDLLIEGGSGSFAELVRRYAPGIPLVAMMKELRAAGTVTEVEGAKLRMLKRSYVPRALNENQIRLWSSVLKDMGVTWEHNLTRTADEPSRFERRAINLKIDRKAVPAFQSFLEEQGMAFLERIDDWLSAHETKDDDCVRLGAGVYYIEDAPMRGTKRRLQRARKPMGRSP
ncbi:MAG TPA: DUF6502 family protein [Steroidobacteraceae bacterium]|nr:DUF6502 family protein [Steroidobacteraceae bacterium]